MTTFPGATGQVSASGQDIFKCFLCTREGNIAQGHFYAGRWFVCHDCVDDAVIIACEASEDHQNLVTLHAELAKG